VERVARLELDVVRGREALGRHADDGLRAGVGERYGAADGERHDVVEQDGGVEGRHVDVER
jgi:hypothetical protein